MKAKQLDGYRQRLLEQRASLIERVRAVEETLETLDREREVEFMDRAQADVPEEVLLRLDEQERKELGEIEAALGRVAQGTFGECERCNQPIDQRRLATLPAARLCVRCQTEAEAAAG
jgi:DnaK suppressor protein